MAGEDVFEHHVSDYEAWFEKNRFAYESELHAIRTLLPKTGRGLEIGVGSGLFAGPLGIKEGIDPSRAMLERARARGVDARFGVAEALPYADQEFDFILVVTAVCFLDDMDLAFSEALRVLRPGGSFIIGFVDRNSPLGKSYEKRKDQSLFYRDATFYAVPELVSHLGKAGFGHFRFVQTLFSPLSDINQTEPVREGFGEGSFVVIEGRTAEGAGDHHS